ncbi:ABC transporter permease [Brumimicrobium aurantiacum]|uniref:Uncharacterized protein n=1 Tax=Brumimicrobium aurantiacum TaxID=1737063 RepID=A0A3E1EX16_9FLAO|nr:ABC transporter permease [Brumimicrobium aurantiacum]RFC54096.1 hypothetical protein DXU93_08895 [Brumimicrobium aurantiacum]
MKQLLKIEFLKLRKLKSLQVIFFIYFLVLPVVIYTISSFITNFMAVLLPPFWKPFIFPYIWEIATYSASYFNILMGVLAVIIITNEFNFKTFRQHLIDGLSLPKAIFSKFLVVLVFALIITLYTFATGLIFGLVNSTDGLPFTEGLEIIGAYFLQTLCYFSFAFFIAVLVKKTAVAIILFILSFMVETIIGVSFSFNGFQTVYAYMPLNAFSKLTPFPILKEVVEAGQQRSGNVPVILDTPINLAVCCGYMFLFFMVSYFILHDRDL